MKIYQCLHKYPLHIEYFENKYNINDEMSFDQIRKLLIEDGYADTYILKPALDGKVDEVFYTIWNYERLQYKWADENGLKSRDLDVIKLAQIEEFKPNVFYNHSAYADNKFILKLGKHSDRIDLCWNGIIKKEPWTSVDYDGHVSLHKPYVAYWSNMGLKSLELQPAIPNAWSKYKNDTRSIDILFYGQLIPKMFKQRIILINKLLKYYHNSSIKFHCHLTYRLRKKTIFKIPFYEKIRLKTPFYTFPKREIRKMSKSPLYGSELYETIANSKIVLNTYTNDNLHYKSNMRLFESTGLGAYLLSEKGTYPDYFLPEKDFSVYQDFKEIVNQVDTILSDWDTYSIIARKTRDKITKIYNKEEQYKNILKFIDSM